MEVAETGGAASNVLGKRKAGGVEVLAADGVILNDEVIRFACLLEGLSAHFLRNPRGFGARKEDA